MTTKLSLDSEENEESVVSGECDESELCLLDISLAREAVLREIIESQKKREKLLEARVASLQTQLEALRKGVQSPEKLPQVG